MLYCWYELGLSVGERTDIERGGEMQDHVPLSLDQGFAARYGTDENTPYCRAGRVFTTSDHCAL